MTETMIAAPERRAYAPEASWLEPDARMMNGGPRKAPPFPVECLGLLGELARDLAASKGAPVDYVATQVLAVSAGVIGAARVVQVRPNWIEPPILWVANIGNPSCGKSPTQRVAECAAQMLERELAGDLAAKRGEYEASKVEAAALRERWEASAKEAVKHGRPPTPMPDEAREPDEPQPPRLVVGDITVEKIGEMNAANPKGLVLIRDELAGLVGNFGRYSGGSDEPAYLSAYNGHATAIDRKKGGSINAPRFFLSILGGIQPDKFQALLSGRDNDGLVSRFLPIWPDLQPRKWTVPQVDESWMLRIFRRLRSLEMIIDSSGELAPRILPLSPDAEKIFAAWYQEQHVKIAGSSGFMADFLGKVDGMCARVALILELLQWAAGLNGPSDGPASVSALSVQRACTLFADYFEPMALRVYADAALPPGERKAVALLREIQQRGVRQFNVREARRTWGVAGISSAADIAAALDVLAECDCIKKAPDQKAGPGRKEVSYLVNPRVVRSLERVA